MVDKTAFVSGLVKGVSPTVKKSQFYVRRSSEMINCIKPGPLNAQLFFFIFCVRRWEVHKKKKNVSRTLPPGQV